MTHAALVNDALFWFLAAMTLLLVMCLTAVILAPSQRPGSHTSHEHQAAVPPPPLPSGQPPASTGPPPLPRRQAPAAVPAAGFHAAPTAGFHGWSAAGGEATEVGVLPPMIHDWIERPKVSGSPPWEPALKPPGLDG
jgi:hypothetical protein